MTMAHLQFKTLILGFLLSLLAVLADDEVAMAIDDQALGNVKGLGYEEKVVVAAQSRSLRGGKIGVKDAMLKKEGRRENNAGANLSSVGKRKHGGKREFSPVMSGRGLSRFSLVGFSPFSSDYHAPKGKDMNSPTKSHATPNTEDSDVLSNTETTGSQKLLEATAEIFKMMNKDYHQKAHRRPPINNNLPVDDENKDVAP